MLAIVSPLLVFPLFVLWLITLAALLFFFYVAPWNPFNTSNYEVECGEQNLSVTKKHSALNVEYTLPIRCSSFSLVLRGMIVGFGPVVSFKAMMLEDTLVSAPCTILPLSGPSGITGSIYAVENAPLGGVFTISSFRGTLVITLSPQSVDVKG